MDKEKQGLAPSDERLPDMTFKLESPFMFEGSMVEEIDMKGLFELNLMDLDRIDREMLRRGVSERNGEVTKLYAAMVAAAVNHKPFEWLNMMKARDVLRLKNMVMAFFYMRV